MLVQPLLQWKSNNYYIFWVWVCSLSYPTRSAHTPCYKCHLWPAPLYNIFPHYLIKVTIFVKKVTENKMCVLIFSTTSSEKFFILREIKQDMIINTHSFSCKLSVILVGFQQNLNFDNLFSKNSEMENLLRARPVGVELFHADGRTDRQTHEAMPSAILRTRVKMKVIGMTCYVKSKFVEWNKGKENFEYFVRNRSGKKYWLFMN
jgi:hypothetical protein